MTPFFRADSPNYHVWIYCWDADTKTMVRRQKSTGTSNRKEEKEGFRLQQVEDDKQKAAQAFQKVIRQIATEYVEGFVGVHPDSTILNYRNALKICLEALGDYAERPKLDMDAPPQVRKWLYQHYSGNTIADRGRFCKRVLRHLIKVTGGEIWWLDDFKVDSQSDGDESPRAMFNEKQCVALKRACDTDEERAFLDFAENLGPRIGDGIRFRTSNYDPTTGLFWYLNTKTNKMCGAWLWPKNLDYVRRVLEKNDGKRACLFPSFNFGVAEDVSGATAWFAKLLITAGIRNDADLIPTKPGLKKVAATHKMRERKKRYRHSFHSYRVTLISQLASLGVPFHIIMAIVGHKDPRTTRRYLRTLSEDIQAASMLHGSGTPGAWQQLASESTAIHQKGPFAQAPLSQPKQLMPPLARTPQMPSSPAQLDPNKAVKLAAVTTTNPPAAGAVDLVIQETAGATSQSLALVPGDPRTVFSAKTMHKDTLMLSSVPKGWPGLKPK
jgi:integrase